MISKYVIFNRSQTVPATADITSYLKHNSWLCNYDSLHRLFRSLRLSIFIYLTLNFEEMEIFFLSRGSFLSLSLTAHLQPGGPLLLRRLLPCLWSSRPPWAWPPLGLLVSGDHMGKHIWAPTVYRRSADSSWVPSHSTPVSGVTHPPLLPARLGDPIHLCSLPAWMLGNLRSVSPSLRRLQVPDLCIPPACRTAQFGWPWNH